MSRRSLAAAAVLAILVLAVYGQTGGHGFLNYDDDVYITKNPIVEQGITLSGLRRALGFHAANWHPLTWASHMLDVELFGLAAGRHHLVSAALHALSAVALMLLLARCTGTLWPGALAAALFAVHPQHVESVAWAAERKDVLAGLLWMLTLAAWIRYARRPGPGSLALAAAVYALGLAAKQSLVSLPLVLLVLDWWPLGRLGRPGGRGRWRPGRLVLEKTPLLLLAAAAGAATLAAQRTGVTLVSPGPAARLKTAVVSTAAYLADTVWPDRLALFYPYPEGGPGPGEVAIAAVVLASLAAGVVLARRRQPWLLAGAAWYVLTLLPVLGMVQVGGQARADRYTYLPHVGVFIAAAWLVRALAGGRARAAGWAAAAAVVSALTLVAHRQAALWKDTVTIMRHSASVTEGNYVALNNLGIAYLDLGRPEEALPVLREAFRVNPGQPNALYNLGLAHYALGRHEEAAGAFARVLRLVPGQLDAHYNLGLAYLRLGRYDLAEQRFAAIVSAAPGFRDAREKLAVARGLAASPAPRPGAE